MRYIITRLREPSTWNAIAVIFGLTGDKAEALVQIGIGASILLGIFLPERAK